MNQRQTKILEYLLKHQKVEVSRLAELFEVSQVTIRKDLTFLEAENMIIREHGFARLNNNDDLNTRLAYHYNEKQLIALKAIENVKDGETVMIESGSCCALVAKALAVHRKDITIITNSAFICDYVRKESISLILLGGQYQKESQVMVGPLTRENVSHFFVDKLFIGTDGFTKQSGFTGKDYLRSETVKDMSKQAKEVIIVTESEKFGLQGTVNLIALSRISKIITDKFISNEYRDYFLSKAITIIES